MRISLLLASALLLSSCAQTPVVSSPPLPPLPQAVKEPPNASAEGTSTESLQTLQHNMQRDLEMSLQQFHNGMLRKLRESLAKVKPSQPDTGPAGGGR